MVEWIQSIEKFPLSVENAIDIVEAVGTVVLASKCDS